MSDDAKILLREVSLWALRVLTLGVASLVMLLLQDVREDVKSNARQTSAITGDMRELRTQVSHWDAEILEMKTRLDKQNDKMEALKDRMWSPRNDQRRSVQ